MRNPSSRKKDDDLSHLTSSSTSSRDQSNPNYSLVDSDSNSAKFTSTYLPQVIDPIEWQQQSSRKRKERQDSTSSITQDRKLVRSNSEEYLPNIDYEVIRRVSSHEEIKNLLIENIDNNSTQSDLRQQQQQQQDKENEEPSKQYHLNDDVCSIKSTNNEVQEILREAHRRAETSPARSRTFDFSHKQRISPNRDTINYGRSGGRDDPDGEQERRRTSERFCKARAAQPARKALSGNKKSSPSSSLTKQSSSSDSEPALREHNDNVYKYNISVMKSERRGFMSKATEHRQYEQNQVLNRSGDDDDDEYDDISSSVSDHNDNNNINVDLSSAPKLKSKHESLPWDCSEEDEIPVISQRFADNKFDHVNNSRDNITKIRNASVTKSSAHFAKAENLKTREIMKSNPLPSVFTSPDEKMKQINKRLTALKKRVTAFEESFERENGYRPSHSVKLNDRYMKNALAEIHKLRKDKQALKSDPMAAMGYKTTQTGSDNKVKKMLDTITEIEKVSSFFFF